MGFMLHLGRPSPAGPLPNRRELFGPSPLSGLVCWNVCKYKRVMRPIVWYISVQAQRVKEWRSVNFIVLFGARLLNFYQFIPCWLKYLRSPTCILSLHLSSLAIFDHALSLGPFPLGILRIFRPWVICLFISGIGFRTKIGHISKFEGNLEMLRPRKLSQPIIIFFDHSVACSSFIVWPISCTSTWYSCCPLKRLEALLQPMHNP